MHISGIIFAWLVFPAAVAAAYFSARLVDTRNAWAQRVEAYREDNAQWAKLAEQKRRQLDDAQARLQRLTNDLGNAWPGANVAVNPGSGELTVDNLGSNQGLGAPDPMAQEKPVVHAFAMQPDGTTRYVGWFQANRLNENDSRFTPQWKPIANEIDSWASGEWRLRAQIPRASAERIPGLYVEHAVLANEIADLAVDLAEQKRRIADAQAQANLREAELVGDPAAEPPVKGLATEFESEQALRDQAEAEVDQLRREIQAAWRQLVDLAEENADLVSGRRAVKPVASAEPDSEPN